MHTLTSLTAIVQVADNGLTLGEVLADLPTDPLSVLAVLMLAGSLALVLWYGRPRGGKGGGAA